MLEIPIFEQTLIYIGQLAMVGASVYMVVKSSEKIGLLFLLAFVLQIQSHYVTTNTNLSFMMECVTSGSSFNDCLPFHYKLSIYLGQFSAVLIGLAIYLSARELYSRKI